MSGKGGVYSFFRPSCDVWCCSWVTNMKSSGDGPWWENCDPVRRHISLDLPSNPTGMAKIVHTWLSLWPSQPNLEPRNDPSKWPIFRWQTSAESYSIDNLILFSASREGLNSQIERHKENITSVGNTSLKKTKGLSQTVRSKWRQN